MEIADLTEIENRMRRRVFRHVPYKGKSWKRLCRMMWRINDLKMELKS